MIGGGTAPRAIRSPASLQLGTSLSRVLIWTAIIALVVAAFALRASGFMVVPRLTDETVEIGLGLRIARGEVLPLTNCNSYCGVFYNYLVAGVFLLVGERIEAGRMLVLVTGALTIIPTYLLGQSLGMSGRRGQVVGLLGAALLAASATHAVVSSRIAYSHSLTPLITTIGFLLLHRSLVRATLRPCYPSHSLRQAKGLSCSRSLPCGTDGDDPSRTALWPVRRYCSRRAAYLPCGPTRRIASPTPSRTTRRCSPSWKPSPPAADAASAYTSTQASPIWRPCRAGGRCSTYGSPSASLSRASP